MEYIKRNALVIALLGVVGYQQVVLTDLMEMHYINNEHIVDTYDKVNGVELYVEDIASDLSEIAASVEYLKDK